MNDIQPSAAHRQVEFVDSIKLFFTNYVDFKGRSSSGEYWWSFLGVVIIGFVFDALDVVLLGASGLTPLGTSWTLGTLIPTIAIGVRRLHDIGKSGWWLLIILTVIGIVLIIYWA